MAAAIQGQHPAAEVELIGGGRGDFIVKADGQELWNKKQMGDAFPQENQILEHLSA